jgi:hypothetical protein
MIGNEMGHVSGTPTHRMNWSLENFAKPSLPEIKPRMNIEITATTTYINIGCITNSFHYNLLTNPSRVQKTLSKAKVQKLATTTGSARH